MQGASHSVHRVKNALTHVLAYQVGCKEYRQVGKSVIQTTNEPFIKHPSSKTDRCLYSLSTIYPSHGPSSGVLHNDTFVRSDPPTRPSQHSQSHTPSLSASLPFQGSQVCHHHTFKSQKHTPSTSPMLHATFAPESVDPKAILIPC